MKFKTDSNTVRMRYFLGIITFTIMMFFMMAFLPLLSGKGFMFFELFEKFFLNSNKLNIMFLGWIFLFQLVGYFSTQSNIRFLEITDNLLVINFFNKKTLTFNYSDISSLEYTKDIFKNFEFTLKNGEKKVVHATIKNKEKAFEIIRQKIQQANQSQIG